MKTVLKISCSMVFKVPLRLKKKFEDIWVVNTEEVENLKSTIA